MRRSAVVFLLKPKEGKVLLAKSRDGGGVGLWSGYGGKIEEGESPTSAAKREVREESSVNIKVGDLIHAAIVNVYWGTVLRYRLYIFTLLKWHGQPRDSIETWKHRWFRYSQLPLKQMRQGDIIWMPRVLAGAQFEADVRLSEDGGLFHKIEYRPKVGQSEYA